MDWLLYGAGAAGLLVALLGFIVAARRGENWSLVRPSARWCRGERNFFHRPEIDTGLRVYDLWEGMEARLLVYPLKWEAWLLVDNAAWVALRFGPLYLVVE